MSRPNNKTQLIEQTLEQYTALTSYLNTLSIEQKTKPNVVGEWATKDVLTHLTAWATMVMEWYAAGKRGEMPATPAEGYTWQQIPLLNQRIYEEYCHQDLDEVLSNFHQAHEKIMAIIHEATDEEMFTPKVYKWTKSTTLGSYFTSATCSHYAWARKEIRKGLKTDTKIS